MIKKVPGLNTLYFVNNSNKRISLEIITGGLDQTSTINVSIDNVDIIKSANGIVPQTFIGDNKTLNGKTLTIICTITDTSRDTNYTELRIRLNGGLFFAEYPLFADVENEGDSITYECNINFFKTL